MSVSPYMNSNPMMAYSSGASAMGGMDPSMMAAMSAGAGGMDPNMLAAMGANPAAYAGVNSSFGMPQAAAGGDQAGLIALVQQLYAKIQQMKAEMMAMFQAAVGPAGSPGSPAAAPAPAPAAAA